MEFPKKFIELKSSILYKRDAFFILLFTCITFLFVFAGESKSQSLYQIKDTNLIKFDSVKIDESRIVKDTLLKKSSSDTLKKKNVKYIMTKSPWKAVMYSAIFPGLGQIYNESYWKLPIVAVAAGSLGYYIFYNNSKFLDYRDKFAESQTTANPSGDSRYKKLRESYRDLRDTYLLYFALFYLINLADAYVDAHLYDFNAYSNVQLGLFQKGNFVNLKLNF